MLVFVLGGITGRIDASFNVNQVVHNILLILIACAPFLVSYLPPKLWSAGFSIY